jgi:uncharacterized protein YggE
MIQVAGDAVVNVKADIVVITFGIETINLSITAAKDSNLAILKRALAAFTNCGLKQNDIHTDYLSIQPQWSYGNNKHEFIGYQARNTVVVTLNDLQQFEVLVSKTLQSGVTNIHGVEYQTSEFKKHRQLARELAIKAAMDKAQQMAAVMGRAIGNPISVSETNPSISRRLPSSSWGYSAMPPTGNSIQYVQPEPAENTAGVPFGEISIRAGVIVTFELKN